MEFEIVDEIDGGLIRVVLKVRRVFLTIFTTIRCFGSVVASDNSGLFDQRDEIFFILMMSLV